jgi:hypothetical protein
MSHFRLSCHFCSRLGDVCHCCYLGFLVHPFPAVVPHTPTEPRWKQSAASVQVQFILLQEKPTVPGKDGGCGPVPCAEGTLSGEGLVVRVVCAMRAGRSGGAVFWNFVPETSVALLTEPEQSTTKDINIVAVGPYRSFIVITPHASADIVHILSGTYYHILSGRKCQSDRPAGSVLI